MAATVAVDTDILLKTCAYQILDEICAELEIALNNLGILGDTRYVLAIRDRAKCDAKLHSTIGAQYLIDRFSKFEKFEPTPEEGDLAANIIKEAQIGAPGDLDEGESILFSICATRGLPLLFTGDKRSIRALAKMPDTFGVKGKLTGQIWCLEQLVLRLSNRDDFEGLCRQIAVLPDVDDALRAIIRHHSTINVSDVRAGLASYIQDLRDDVGDLLVDN